MIDYARTKRIPQEGDGETDRLCKLLNEAASITRTTLESIQTLAGTTVCKVVQIAYFIDTIIYRTSPDTFTTYKSQSPRYSS